MKTIFLAILTVAGLFGAPANAQGEAWREVSPENLVLIETAFGTTALELNADFAPNHVQRFREMVRAGDLKNSFFYRVIDGFVAQGGPNGKASREWAPMQNENDRELRPLPFTPLGNGDLYAAEVGHSPDGFAMAQDTKLNREWLLHCPGAVALARDSDPDSGTSEFYIALDAQRYLDRNLTVFARVIDGMQYIQKLERGDPKVASGVIQPPRTGDEMISVKIAADIDVSARPTYLVQKPGTGPFEGAKQGARVRTSEFFYRKPAEVIDICDFEVPVRRVGE